MSCESHMPYPCFWGITPVSVSNDLSTYLFLFLTMRAGMRTRHACNAVSIYFLVDSP